VHTGLYRNIYKSTAGSRLPLLADYNLWCLVRNTCCISGLVLLRVL